MKNLTELEIKVIEAISKGDDFNDMPCMCIEDISSGTGISTKILRGVLSSLLQKDILREGEYPNGMTAFHLDETKIVNFKMSKIINSLIDEISNVGYSVGKINAINNTLQVTVHLPRTESIDKIYWESVEKLLKSKNFVKKYSKNFRTGKIIENTSFLLITIYLEDGLTEVNNRIKGNFIKYIRTFNSYDTFIKNTLKLTNIASKLTKINGLLTKDEVKKIYSIKHIVIKYLYYYGFVDKVMIQESEFETLFLFKIKDSDITFHIPERIVNNKFQYTSLKSKSSYEKINELYIKKEVELDSSINYDDILDEFSFLADINAFAFDITNILK